MTDVSATIEFITTTSSKVLLALALLGGYRQWYVWHWQYRAMQEDRDEWKSIAKQSLHLASSKEPRS